MHAYGFTRALVITLRIYLGGFTDFTSDVISALGYLPLWGNSKSVPKRAGAALETAVLLL